MPYARDFGEDLHEAGTAILRRFGKIRATPKRSAVSVQTHGQGPAALFAHHGQGRHIYVVHVGALFAVKLDANEMRVHQGGHVIIFKAFMRHDVTPMTRGIPDRQKDRDIAPPRFFKHLGFPWLPMHRVVLVL